jgi:hypothetical protein
VQRTFGRRIMAGGHDQRTRQHNTDPPCAEAGFRTGARTP